MADLTDVTITPMIPVGIAAATVIIHWLSGWNIWIALVAAVVPGAIAGFFLGVGLTIVASWLLERVLPRHKKSDPS